MFSVRLLIDRLATLQPRTGLTRVWLSSAVSCKIKKNLIIIVQCISLKKTDSFFFSPEQ